MRGELVPGQTKLPSPGFELRMPDGTPFGIGFLGAARFSAIKRVLDRAERAYRAAGMLIDARSEVNNALVRHASSIEQLENLDTIRGQVATRIVEGAEIERLRLTLERMELEDQIEARTLARAKMRKASEPASPAAPPEPPQVDKVANFIRNMKRMPDIAKVASAVKAEIIKNAGGDGSLSEADRQMIESIEVMLTAFVQKQAEEQIL